MLREEFERIAGRTVTAEQYKHIEALYMDSNVDKYSFVKSIKPLLKTLPEVKKHPVLVMARHNYYGNMRTPNGCYYMTVKVELIDVNIRSGKRTVRVIPDSFDFTYGYDLTDWDRHLIIENEDGTTEVNE